MKIIDLSNHEPSELPFGKTEVAFSYFAPMADKSRW
jgi:hypothetical protein